MNTDIESKIINCWNVVDDIKLLVEQQAELEAFAALATVYQHKFKSLFADYELSLRMAALDELTAESQRLGLYDTEKEYSYSFTLTNHNPSFLSEDDYQYGTIVVHDAFSSRSVTAYDLLPLRGDSRIEFASWLSQYRSGTVLTTDQLTAEYEKTHTPLVWWSPHAS